MSEKSSRTPNFVMRRSAAAATIATIALGAAGIAHGSTGGASFDKAPPTASQINSKGACPKVEKIKSKTTISAGCQKFLLKTLHRSVFDDVDPQLAFASYQTVAKLSDVDGIPGPDTTRSILKGKSLRVPLPSTSSHTRRGGVLIDKSDQIAYIMGKGKKGSVKHIIRVSTGTEKPYSDMGNDGKIYSGVGDTPTGNFNINRVEPANYPGGGLGAMPYARFTEHPAGIAIHSGYVTIRGRESHGCIRVNPGTMERFVVPAVNMNTPVTIRE